MRALARAIDDMELPAVEKIAAERQERPFDVLISTMLSAQTRDPVTAAASARLFRVARTPRALAKLSVRRIERLIYPVSFYRHKARHVKATCRLLVERFGGRVPGRLDDLVTLPGVGRKTANVVLGNAFGVNSGVVVDTHVARLSQRLGLTRQTDPVKIEQELMTLVSRDQWTMFSHWLIWHGRRRCVARSPDCPQCEIKALCPRIGVGK